MGRYFEEFVEGEVVDSGKRMITEGDVMNFAALTGDWNELHTSDEFARKNGFPQRIAHGAFIFAVSIGLLQSDSVRQPNLIALIGVDRLRFANPVLLGDTIRVRQTVRALNPVNLQSGVLEAAAEVLNQNDAVTVSYLAKLLVRRSGKHWQHRLA